MMKKTVVDLIEILMKIETEAFMTVSRQTELFLLSVGIGAALGVVYDVFRALRAMLPPLGKTVPTAVCDIIYMIIAGLFIYLFSLIAAGGEIRGYYWLGALLGWIIYIFTVGAAVIGVIRTVFSFIYKCLSKVYMIISKPFIVMLQKTREKTNRIFVINAKKIHINCKKNKKHLKNIGVMMYNKIIKIK